MRKKEKAWLHFYPEGNGRALKGYVLHHKDPSWKMSNPERYHQWNPQDLQMLTRAEHVRIHNSGQKNPMWGRTGEKNPMFGKHHSGETRKRISESLKGEKSPNYGKHLSGETRKKLSEAIKAYWRKRHEENHIEN